VDVAEIVTGVVAIAGAALITLAGFGVLRMPDLYARMHAATKASTLGIGLVAAAGAVGIDGAAPKVLLAAVSIFITAPSAAHLIGRGAYRAEGIDVHLNGEDDLRGLFDPPADEVDDHA
jgi:multicomponent Na+:H+ antiporter subunit G